MDEKSTSKPELVLLREFMTDFSGETSNIQKIYVAAIKIIPVSIPLLETDSGQLQPTLPTLSYQ